MQKPDQALSSWLFWLAGSAGGFDGAGDREWMGWRTTPERRELELSAAKEEERYDR